MNSEIWYCIYLDIQNEEYTGPVHVYLNNFELHFLAGTYK